MTNFDFLKNESQFAAFADACIEAENSISVSPALCALGVRKSAELAVLTATFVCHTKIISQLWFTISPS